MFSGRSVIAHYQKQGFNEGIHGEGSTFSTLFALLMWDIIFMMGISDVFRNPYQTCPLDLYTDSFYENRKKAIDSRVELISSATVDTLHSMLEDVWTTQEGKVCSLINWERFSSLQQAQSLVSCLNLVVWNTSNNTYKLVEVKGQMTDCPKSNRSGWTSFKNWVLMWRCVMSLLLEPKDCVKNKITKENFRKRRNMVLLKLFLFVYLLNYTEGHYRNPLNKYILHYEGLSYDTDLVHHYHQRAKRALSHQDKFLHLDFHAHGRHFNLRMKRDTSLFAQDLKVDVSGEEIPYDTSHIYTGEIYGEKNTLTHGSIVDGKFEGFIQSYQGTYYVEPADRYLEGKNVPFHSVMYHEDDIHYPHKYGPEGGCANSSVFERMRKYQSSGVQEPLKDDHMDEYSDGPVLLRRRRMAQAEKNTCQLFIQTDHLFYKYYKTREAVIAQISSHVKAIDAIYQGTDFMGIRNISFMVKRIRINTTSDERDRSNPFRFANIGVEKFLELNSEQNHDDYCLAYVFTDRDFDDGVLGLAWVGAPSGSSGGICEKSKLYSDGKKKSLNTGIITVQNYASHVPPKVSHITFAHEVGHNFGSPHDSGAECTPGESKSQDKKEKGNYIMYARATSGDKLNNNKFSICSVRNISQVLEKKRGNCFVGLVSPSVEWAGGAWRAVPTVATASVQRLCYDANQPDNKKCKSSGKLQVLSRGVGVCSPGHVQWSESQCPTSEPKANFTACHGETQVCLNGGCSGSICEKYGLEACTCASQDGKDETELCHVCCMEKMNPSTCRSTGSEKLAQFFNKKVTTLPAGSPCNDFKGYCDVFMKCRLVDADGPLARLKKAIFNPELYENIAEWIVAHWWAVLLMGIALIMLMAGFIKICSVHTPSSNPKLPPPKPLPGTLKRRRAQQHASSQVQHQSRDPHGHGGGHGGHGGGHGGGGQRQQQQQQQRQPSRSSQQQQQRHHRQPRENYQMGQMRR
ncbi:hypothetical protein WMY93_022990 [Mugilogobius chulae]|uniref:Peptidase M12B domain-containing protein n=1 Tax=Mugilogobius chulae TaxID=88201 RepID=A0AAW0N7I4_9GOBI